MNPRHKSKKCKQRTVLGIVLEFVAVGSSCMTLLQGVLRVFYKSSSRHAWWLDAGQPSQIASVHKRNLPSVARVYVFCTFTYFVRIYNEEEFGVVGRRSRSVKSHTRRSQCHVIPTLFSHHRWGKFQTQHPQALLSPLSRVDARGFLSP